LYLHFNVILDLHLHLQVVTSSGPSGHNVEYLLKLAEWLHDALPEVWGSLPCWTIHYQATP